MWCKEAQDEARTMPGFPGEIEELEIGWSMDDRFCSSAGGGNTCFVLILPTNHHSAKDDHPTHITLDSSTSLFISEPLISSNAHPRQAIDKTTSTWGTMAEQSHFNIETYDDKRMPHMCVVLCAVKDNACYINKRDGGWVETHVVG